MSLNTYLGDGMSEWSQMEMRHLMDWESGIYECNEIEDWSVVHHIQNWTEEDWVSGRVRESWREGGLLFCYKAEIPYEEMKQYLEKKFFIWAIQDDHVVRRETTIEEIVDRDWCRQSQRATWQIMLRRKVPMEAKKIEFIREIVLTLHEEQVYEAEGLKELLIDHDMIRYYVERDSGKRKTKIEVPEVVKLKLMQQFSKKEMRTVLQLRSGQILNLKIDPVLGEPLQYRVRPGKGKILKEHRDEEWQVNVMSDCDEQVDLKGDIPQQVIHRVVKQEKEVSPDFLHQTYYYENMESYSLQTFREHEQLIAKLLKHVPERMPIIAPGDGLGIVKGIRPSSYCSDPVNCTWTRLGVKKENFAETWKATRELREQMVQPLLICSYIWNVITSDDRNSIRTYGGPLLILDNSFSTTLEGFKQVGVGCFVRNFPWRVEKEVKAEGVKPIKSVLYTENMQAVGVTPCGIGRSADYLRHTAPLAQGTMKLVENLQSLMEEIVSLDEEVYLSQAGIRMRKRDIIPFVGGDQKILSRTVYVKNEEVEHEFQEPPQQTYTVGGQTYFLYFSAVKGVRERNGSNIPQKQEVFSIMAVANDKEYFVAEIATIRGKKSIRFEVMTEEDESFLIEHEVGHGNKIREAIEKRKQSRSGKSKGVKLKKKKEKDEGGSLSLKSQLEPYLPP